LITLTPLPLSAAFLPDADAISPVYAAAAAIVFSLLPLACWLIIAATIRCRLRDACCRYAISAIQIRLSHADYAIRPPLFFFHGFVYFSRLSVAAIFSLLITLAAFSLPLRCR